MDKQITYEGLLQRMLDRAPADMDKREGSLLYDALAPAAAELQQMYIELGLVMDETYADTATREFLMKRAAERGIVPYPATAALLQGEFNIDVAIGSRFSGGDFNYVVTAKAAAGVFHLACETPGRAGNQYLGPLVPVEYTPGLEQAALTRLLTPGEDEEDTEALRKRYFASLDSQSFGGNVADYLEKTNALPGVGGVKVYPVWNGGGTVRLAFVNSEYGVPAAELVADVQNAVDPPPQGGYGLGFAPIGHVVTVQGVTGAKVNVSAEITYQTGWSWEEVRPYAEQALDAYLLELAQGWAEEPALVVRVSQIETRFLGLSGIVDIANTKINGIAENLVLAADQIPERGELHG